MLMLHPLSVKLSFYLALSDIFATMAKVEKTVLVEHAAATMFNLVDGVEEYPQFLPWCGGADVKWRDELTTVATIHINYMGVKQSFTTKNSKRAPEEMNLSLQDGPFAHLHGHWRFLKLGEFACKIEFSLDYHFSSRMLDTLLSPVFNHIANTFVDAFVARADRIQTNPA
jgi:ribosome-associated toxin RatA of RatAB toxin-antitoxin module